MTSVCDTRTCKGFWNKVVLNVATFLKTGVRVTMDYLRMDGKQYASKVRNKALEHFDWLSQWLE